jgi:hypothetical protein
MTPSAGVHTIRSAPAPCAHAQQTCRRAAACNEMHRSRSCTVHACLCHVSRHVLCMPCAMSCTVLNGEPPSIPHVPPLPPPRRAEAYRHTPEGSAAQRSGAGAAWVATCGGVRAELSGTSACAAPAARAGESAVASAFTSAQRRSRAHPAAAQRLRSSSPRHRGCTMMALRVSAPAGGKHLCRQAAARRAARRQLRRLRDAGRRTSTSGADAEPHHICPGAPHGQ